MNEILRRQQKWNEFKDLQKTYMQLRRNARKENKDVVETEIVSETDTKWKLRKLMKNHVKTGETLAFFGISRFGTLLAIA